MSLQLYEIRPHQPVYKVTPSSISKVKIANSSNNQVLFNRNIEFEYIHDIEVQRPLSDKISKTSCIELFIKEEDAKRYFKYLFLLRVKQYENSNDINITFTKLQKATFPELCAEIEHVKEKVISKLARYKRELLNQIR